MNLFNNINNLSGLNLSFQNNMCVTYNRLNNTLIVKCKNINVLPTEDTNDNIWKKITNKNYISTLKLYTNDNVFLTNNELLLNKFNSTENKIRKLYLKCKSATITLEFKKIEFNKVTYVFIISLYDVLRTCIEKYIYKVDYIVIDSSSSIIKYYGGWCINNQNGATQCTSWCPGPVPGGVIPTLPTQYVLVVLPSSQTRPPSTCN